MSQTRYGIRRFALLNTAGYSLGIFPLENPLSIYGVDDGEIEPLMASDEELSEESEEDALARAIAEEHAQQEADA